MNVALTALAPREALALEMLIGKLQPDWRCSVVPASAEAALPPADLYVIDLAGKGLSRWSEAAQASLLHALDGAPAVLIASAFDPTWAVLDAGGKKGNSLVLLRKPYGIEDMRLALKRAAQVHGKRLAPAALPATPVVPVTPVTPAAGTAPGEAGVSAGSSSPVPAMAPVGTGGIDPAEFQARLEALPMAEPRLFLRQLGQALALRRPFEIRVSFLHRLIFNPDERWVASNTPISVLQGLCHSDKLAAATSMDAIDKKDVMARAQRLELQLQPLEAFLGSLMPGRGVRQQIAPTQAS